MRLSLSQEDNTTELESKPKMTGGWYDAVMILNTHALNEAALESDHKTLNSLWQV